MLSTVYNPNNHYGKVKKGKRNAHQSLFANKMIFIEEVNFFFLISDPKIAFLCTQSQLNNLMGRCF
jgi:hypothetical protein